MKEYVVRIVARDPDYPLREEVVMEGGTPASDPEAFSKAVFGLLSLIKLVGSVEEAKKVHRQHEVLSQMKQMARVFH